MNKEKLQEVLYDKTYNCPVCDRTFTSKAIRSGRNKVVKTSTDLYSEYSIVNPVLYDVIVCKCGYAGISNVFEKLRSRQIKLIKAEVTKKYVKTSYPEFLTTRDAINRYKLALVSSLVKKSRLGEQAYICLKLGWLYRDIDDPENERCYLEHARKLFIEAYSSERFPIFELDENTTIYLIAELSRQADKMSDARRWIGELLIKPRVSQRLKTRAEDLRDSLPKSI